MPQLNLVLAPDSFLYPLETTDLEALQALGYAHARIAFRAFTALRLTLLKGLDAKQVKMWTFESTAALMLNKFFQALERDLPARALSIRDRQSCLLPENQTDTLSSGIQFAVRHRAVNLELVDTSLSLLRQYMGRFKYSVNTTTEDADAGWRVFTVQFAFSEDLPFFVNYGLDANSQDEQHLALNNFMRLTLRRAQTAGRPSLTVVLQDKIGDKWVDQGQQRTFPVTPAMAGSAVEVASWLLATFAPPSEAQQ